MPSLFTLREYINATLDKSYNRATSGVFQQIVRMATGQGSAIQAAMRELEAEAERLQEAGEVMRPDNPTVVKSLSVIEDEMVMTQNLILANGAEIEQSGQEVAPVATIAKLMMGITAVLLSRGVNPLRSEAVYRDAIAEGGLGFVIPDGLDFVRMYTQSQAWIDRMEGWGVGYADIIGKLAQKGVSEGWGPIRMAREIRQYAENIPIWASENITRTLQLHAYRDASAAMELINGKFIEKKVRIAALDRRTCPACLALHGTEIPLGQPVEDHYNGRCDAILIPVGGSMPESMQAFSKPGERNFVPWQNGEDWFAGLTDEQQRAFLGPGKFEVYKSGVPLSEFWHTHTDSVFGDMPVVKPLKDLRGVRFVC